MTHFNDIEISDGVFLRIEILRQKRKTLALYVKEGFLLVKVPMKYPESGIEAFILSHRRFILRRLGDFETRPEKRHYSKEELAAARPKAVDCFNERVSYYSNLSGFFPKSVRVLSAKRKFGSCSFDNRIIFSIYTYFLPDDLRDYIVVHELCHIKEKNHSRRFYNEVAKILPDCKELQKRLKSEGALVMPD